MTSFPHVNDPMSDDERANFYSCMIDSCLDAVVVGDEHGVVVEWNANSARIFGWTRDEAIGRRIDELIVPPAMIGAHRVSMKRYLDERSPRIIGRMIEVEALHRSGACFPIELTVSVMMHRDATFFIARCRNISVRVATQNRLKLQARELDHRVKNTLAVFMGIARLIARTAKTVPDFIEAFEHRVVAYKQTHELLSEARHGGVWLRQLLIVEFRPLGLDRVTMMGDDLFLPPRVALTLGMCIHEMTTNAVKYGSLGERGGRLAVTWSLTADGAFTMDWVETGGPEPNPQPTRRGFGSYLVSNVLKTDLRGTLAVRYPSTGLVGRVTIPMAPLLETQPR